MRGRSAPHSYPSLADSRSPPLLSLSLSKDSPPPSLPSLLPAKSVHERLQGGLLLLAPPKCLLEEAGPPAGRHTLPLSAFFFWKDEETRGGCGQPIDRTRRGRGQVQKIKKKKGKKGGSSRCPLFLTLPGSLAAAAPPPAAPPCS